MATTINDPITKRELASVLETVARTVFEYEDAEVDIYGDCLTLWLEDGIWQIRRDDDGWSVKREGDDE